MKILAPTRIAGPQTAIADKHCPICYASGKEAGYVDGGLIRDGDVVEWSHAACGHKWTETISIERAEK